MDVVFVTGDAYVDHPAFAMGILGRVLEAAGFRVAILSQPDWKSAEPWRQFGRPRLFFGISAGNMDSMINHYTANKKVRNDDAYSPGGRIGLRPDRATIPYCQRAREAFPGVPVIAGGVEASLRRLAHYDYWSDTVKRSILLDAKADLVVFGMGEQQIVEIAARLAAGETGARTCATCGASPTPSGRSEYAARRRAIVLPSLRGGEDRQADSSPWPPGSSTRKPTRSTPDAWCSTTTARRWSATRPPCRSARRTWTAIYGLPYTRKPHPMYQGEPIPAYEMVKDSVTIMRGCFGGCTFCSITAHQGRIIQSRSQESVLDELRQMGAGPGVLGRRLRHRRPDRQHVPDALHAARGRGEVQAALVRASQDLQAARHRPRPAGRVDAREPRGRRASTRCSSPRASAWTWPSKSPEYMEELAAHHVGGHLKVAPEHTDPDVLELMKKPDVDDFEGFAEAFKAGQRQGGQEAVPGALLHRLAPGQRPGRDDRPGRCSSSGTATGPTRCRTSSRRRSTSPRACTTRASIRSPAKRSTSPRHLRDRKLQRALMQFFKPENYFEVRKALLKAGRQDLIGSGCDCLIPAPAPEGGYQGQDGESQQVAGRGGVRPPDPELGTQQGLSARPEVGSEEAGEEVRAALW